MVKLSELFKVHQEQMQALMNYKLSQSVAQGDNTETAWIEFFKQYLPSRYSCDKGFVIDSKGGCSEQIDLIVYDNYFSPFLLNNKAVKYIPRESVYAVFEIKPELSKNNFEYANRKIESVRKLFCTSAPVICNGRVIEGRKPFNIIGGLLTIKNSWKTQLLKQKINFKSDDYLDMGCCIKGKSWKIVYDDDIDRKSGKYEWNKDEKQSLLAFFMELLYELQRNGSAPAMDIQKYYSGF